MYKNCGHAIVLHKRNCLSKAVEIEDDISGCAGAQYYNGLILGTYVGWAEIHCNSSAVLLTSAAGSKTVEIEQIG
jgi:hypothetical protein